MVSLLDSALKQKVAAAFKGKLTRGILRKTAGVTRDSNGDRSTGTVTTYTFEGIREDFSLFHKANSGIPETDVRILLILGSLNPATTVQKDNQIYLNTPWNAWYQVRRVLTIDPAGASCSVQAYEIPDPTV